MLKRKISESPIWNYWRMNGNVHKNMQDSAWHILSTQQMLANISDVYTLSLSSHWANLPSPDLSTRGQISIWEYSKRLILIICPRSQSSTVKEVTVAVWKTIWRPGTFGHFNHSTQKSLSSHPIYTPDCKLEKQEQRLGVNDGKKCSKATVSGELGEDGLEENKIFKYKAPFQVQSSKMSEVSRTMWHYGITIQESSGRAATDHSCGLLARAGPTQRQDVP